MAPRGKRFNRCLTAARRKTVRRFAVLCLPITAPLCLCIGAQAQFAYQTTSAQSVYNAAATSGTGGLLGFNTSGANYKIGDTATEDGEEASSNGDYLLYTAIGTLSATVVGTIPNTGNNCQTMTLFNLSGPSVFHYLFSFNYSQTAAIPQLNTGFAVTHGATVLATAANPGATVGSSGVVDISDGAGLQLQSWLSGNLATTATGSFTTTASLQTLPSSPIPIGGIQPTSGADAVWSQPVNGNWSSQTSWLQNMLPASGIDTFLNTGSSTPYTVYLTSSTAARSLTVQGDNVTLAMQGNNASAGQLNVVGFAGRTGSLVLAGPGTFSPASTEVSATGDLAISGATLSENIFNSVILDSGAALSISNGGSVNSPGLSIGSASLLSMTVGDGSSINLFQTLPYTGILNYSGTVRLEAIPAAAAGSTYQPITALAWNGSGTVQALGGTFNTSTKIFTASSVAAGTSGNAVNIDLSQIQRVQITDAASQQTVDASFLAVPLSTNISFTATPLTSMQTSLLQDLIGPSETVDSGWTFTDTGLSAGSPLYLSMDVGTGVSDLSVWHFDGSEWTPFTADDLSYDGRDASFTVTGFSGYAVTSAVSVPEPAGVLLMLSSSILARRRRSPGT
jgi:hypothetical protein